MGKLGIPLQNFRSELLRFAMWLALSLAMHLRGVTTLVGMGSVSFVLEPPKSFPHRSHPPLLLLLLCVRGGAAPDSPQSADEAVDRPFGVQGDDVPNVQKAGHFIHGSSGFFFPTL